MPPVQRSRTGQPGPAPLKCSHSHDFPPHLTSGHQSQWKMTSTQQNLIGQSLPHLAPPLRLTLLLLWCALCLLPATKVSAGMCRVSGGVLGIHWSSVIGLGWHPLAVGRGSARCWESCCMDPACGAVWTLQRHCVLLNCPEPGGCSTAALPSSGLLSHGLLQELEKSSPVRKRRPRASGTQAAEEAHSQQQGAQPLSPPPPNSETTNPVSSPVAANGMALPQAGNRSQSPAANASTEVASSLLKHHNVTEGRVVTMVTDGSTTSVTTGPATFVSTSPATNIRELVVSAGESVEVTLPHNEVMLNAFVLPAPPQGTDYRFDWRLITHPQDYSGEMEGKHSKILKLSKLTVGFYEFEVLVEGEGAQGEGYVNVTVKPEPRVNKPPVAVVSPKFQEISLPTSSTVIDGSHSTDDDKIVAWHWEEVKGPLRDEKVSADTPILKLTSLVPGNYTFSLTVTDSDGAQSSTQALLLVNKAMDYPPVANAGPNQVITLPHNSITLYGNQSTDDHEPLSYEWSLSPESKGKVVEMQGVLTPTLQLSAMQEGDYTFQLTVTDSAGQQDTAHVTVIVQPENNKPPVADAGPEKELTLPVDRTTLDGSKSSDDQKIATYHWSQSSGPEGVKIENADGAVATVTGLRVGKYEFSLTVTDERKLQDTVTVTVIVKEEQDQAPVARVVSGQTVSLPVRTTALDGSHSTDDKGVVSYMWTRDESSPAAGDVLNNSDHQAVLLLGNLVVGKYSFTLTVTDSKGQSSTDTGSVEVRPDLWERDLVEMIVEVGVSSVSLRQREMLFRQVGVLLGLLESDIVVREISAFNERSTRIVFLVSGGPGHPPLSGHSVALLLRSKLRKQRNDFLIFKARRVDTVICQLNCSGHGECDSFTRRCVCHPFWMENFIRVQLGDAESNCEWSVLYVTIASFMILVAVGTLVWGVVCCCNRRKSRMHRKSRYKILEAYEKDSVEMQPPRPGRLKPMPAPSSSSLMRSDSDLDSDDGQGGSTWSERERGHLLKPQNGSLRNGQAPLWAKKQREELLL